MNKTIWIFVAIFCVILGGIAFLKPWSRTATILSFESEDLVLDNVGSGTKITSPLQITGRAKGNWFFEASFPVTLVNWDGLIIAQGVATAKSDWMTADFVPFETTLTFETPAHVNGRPENNGAIILKKDNPSGLPENDKAYEIPIVF